MGLFSRTRKPIPPYDTLEVEQRYALYFLLEYLTEQGSIPLHELSWALQYLEKAAIIKGDKTEEEVKTAYYPKSKSVFT